MFSHKYLKVILLLNNEGFGQTKITVIRGLLAAMLQFWNCPLSVLAISRFYQDENFKLASPQFRPRPSNTKCSVWPCPILVAKANHSQVKG